MTPYFNTRERLSSLERAALGWIGTPFVPNASVKGHGVSCQKLAGALYKEAGFLPSDFEIPEGPMDQGAARKDSLVRQFMASQTERFQEVDRTTAQAGDLIGFLEGACINHLGVVLRLNRFVLCGRREGVKIRDIKDAVYLRLRSAVWRPVE